MPLTIQQLQQKEQELLELFQSIPEILQTKDLKYFEQLLLKFFINLDDLDGKKPIELKYRQSELKKLEIMNNGINDLLTILRQ